MRYVVKPWGDWEGERCVGGFIGFPKPTSWNLFHNRTLITSRHKKQQSYFRTLCISKTWPSLGLYHVYIFSIVKFQSSQEHPLTAIEKELSAASSVFDLLCYSVVFYTTSGYAITTVCRMRFVLAAVNTVLLYVHLSACITLVMLFTEAQIVWALQTNKLV